MWKVMACIVAVSVATAAPIPKSMLKKQTSDIVGRWKVKESGSEIWEFKDDGTATYGHERPTGSAKYTTNAGADPLELDWCQDNNMSWNLAIYKIDGDELTINFSAPGNARPAEIAKPSSARHVIFTRIRD